VISGTRAALACRSFTPSVRSAHGARAEPPSNLHPGGLARRGLTAPGERPGAPDRDISVAAAAISRASPRGPLPELPSSI